MSSDFAIRIEQVGRLLRPRGSAALLASLNIESARRVQAVLKLLNAKSALCVSRENAPHLN